MSAFPVKSLNDLIESGVIQLTRGKIISKKDIAACPGSYPIYSSAKDNDGKFGEYGKFLFDEELITWSVDGGGRLFHRPKHRFSVTNVGGVLRIRDTSVIDYRYLFYALTLRHSEISFDWVKKAHPSVIRKLYIDIPLPPLPEQQRIVALLVEAFAGLATAKANAEQNLRNARALFESHLQSVFSQRGEGWVEATLGEVCEMYQPKTIGLKDLVSDGQYPVFGANGIIGQYDKFNHEKPQLLITCRGATCGAVNISEPFSWITGNAMVVRPLGESLDLGYLEYAFRGGINTSEVITGSAQPQITRTNLSPLPISFPFSVEEQQRLAVSFRSLAAETQRLTRLYERKLAALEELKKSLLHQAFNGEL